MPEHGNRGMGLIAEAGESPQSKLCGSSSARNTKDHTIAKCNIFKHYNVLIPKFLCVCGLLSGCNEKVSLNRNETSPVEITFTLERKYQVINIYLFILETYTLKLLLCVKWITATANCKLIQLISLNIYAITRCIYEFNFVALPPIGISA